MARDLVNTTGYLPLFAGTEVVRRGNLLAPSILANVPPAPPVPPVRASILAWWDLEENLLTTNFEDATGNGNTLVTNLNTQDLHAAGAGKVGMGFSRGGEGGVYTSRRIYIPRAASGPLDFGFTDSFTMGMWYNPTRVSDAAWGRMIAGRLAGTTGSSGGTTGTGGFLNSSYGFSSYDGQLYFVILTNLLNASSVSLATPYPAVGTWAFVAASIDVPNLTMKLYRDGNAPISGSIPSGARHGPTVKGNFILSQPLYDDLSTDTDIASRQTDARMDGVFLSNTVLTPANIAAIYNGGAGVNWTQFVALNI